MPPPLPSILLSGVVIDIMFMKWKGTLLPIITYTWFALIISTIINKLTIINYKTNPHEDI